jgi:hypothetical protein
MRKVALTEILVVACAVSALSILPEMAAAAAQCAVGCPAPGPIPGAGVLSFVALGLIGLGTAGLKRLRRNRDE